MKTLLRMALVVSLVSLAAGCASSGSSFAGTKNATPFAADQAYVSQVEAIARKRGVQVHWVNPPRAERQEIAGR